MKFRLNLQHCHGIQWPPMAVHAADQLVETETERKSLITKLMVLTLIKTLLIQDDRLLEK